MSEAAETPGVGRVTKLLPVAVLGAAICLFASELMILFEFTPPGGEAQCEMGNGDRHANAQMVVSAFAVIAMLVAVFGPSRPAAVAVAVMGIIGLLIFLIADLRFANTVGTLGEACSPATSLVDAKAVPQGGFYLELLGALALAVTGIALATFTPEQLAALRPAKRARPTEARGDEDEPAPHKPDERGKGRLGKLGRTRTRQPD